MKKLVPLSNTQHKDLKIDLSKAALHGKNTNIVPIIPNEFPNAAVEYPIVLTKSEKTGQYKTCVVLGFEREENLFFQEEHWDALYLPLQIQRQPFFAGNPEDLNLENNGDYIVCIDQDSPTVSETEGQALFNEDGSDTEFFTKAKELLAELLNGEHSTANFVAQLEQYDLIQPMNTEIAFVNDTKVNLNGLYTISQKKLAELSDEDYLALRKTNYLQAIYIMLTSINHLYRLIEKKNRLIEQQ